MEKRKYYKIIFMIDAVKAWLLAIMAYAMGAGDIGLEGTMYFNGFMMAVIVVGIGYFIIGLDIDKNHGLVITSIIIQAAVFMFFTYYFAIGVAASLQFGAGIIDLIFAILFTEFLLNYKKLPAK